MTNDNSIIKKEQPTDNENAVVVNNIILRNVDRTIKDIASWRNAHIAAERIVYPIRQRLYDVYADVELDGHLKGITDKRFKTITNKKIYFKNSAGQKVDALDELLKKPAFRRLKREILKTIMWGITGFEFIPGKEFEWVEIPRKHIKPEYKIIAKEQTGFEGVEYDKMPNVIVIGDPHDLGLLLHCSPYALWKRGGFADYAQFVEIFGQPVRIFEYDAYDIKTKNEVQNVADNAGGAMSLIIPKQAGFRMEDGKTANANGDLQTQFVKCLNDEMSVIVLGNTQTTTSSEGSGYAQSKEHGEQQDEFTNDDMDFLLQHLNDDKFIKLLQSYGYPVAGGEFAFETVVDAAKLTSRIEVDKEVAKLVPIDDDYFYDTYHIPKPANYNELKAKMEEDRQAQNQPPSAPVKEKVKSKKAKAEKPDDADDELEDLSAEDGVGWFNRFRTAMADFFAPAP